jgi:hypothetical protein
LWSQEKEERSEKMKVKCAYCKNEINAFDLATCDINGKKRYVHTECWISHQAERLAILRAKVRQR